MPNFDSIIDAFETNNFVKFKTLLSKVENINATNDDMLTIFFELCFRFRFDQNTKELIPYIDHMLELGAQINILDSNNRSPLSNFAQQGYLDLVKYLVKRGANVNSSKDNCSGPVHYAIRSDQVAVVKFFLSVKSFDKSVKVFDESLGKFAKSKKSNKCIALFKEMNIK